ncbi:MAG: GYD domain-containing protein [Alphaproteobacteria bacterium]|nr:GYD domain-containing protein [Alphaproteobacteria bacterium]
MAIYITQGRYTDHAMKGMVDHPVDRAPAVAALIEAAGGKMLDYYVTLGEYDFLIVSEADPANSDYLAALMVAGATGGVANLTSTQAFTTAEAKSAMEKANKIRAGFQPAGG